MRARRARLDAPGPADSDQPQMVEVRVAFSLVPRSKNFFDDFVGLSEEIRGGAKLLKQMMSSDPPDMGKADAIKDVEHNCDERTRAIVTCGQNGRFSGR